MVIPRYLVPVEIVPVCYSSKCIWEVVIKPIVFCGPSKYTCDGSDSVSRVKFLHRRTLGGVLVVCISLHRVVHNYVCVSGAACMSHVAWVFSMSCVCGFLCSGCVITSTVLHSCVVLSCVNDAYLVSPVSVSISPILSCVSDGYFSCVSSTKETIPCYLLSYLLSGNANRHSK